MAARKAARGRVSDADKRRAKAAGKKPARKLSAAAKNKLRDSKGRISDADLKAARAAAGIKRKTARKRR